jgi:Bacterial regulatory helix-turn-helix protein, lysR family
VIIAARSHLDTLLSMKVFRQVVESGSFVDAAERQNLSTAVTSKHLVFLEKHLGIRRTLIYESDSTYRNI